MREYVATALVLVAGLTSSLVAAAPAAELWAIWDASDESNGATIEHVAWQQFLDRYVVPGTAGINLVGYRRVAAADRQQLQSYLRRLSDLDPRNFRRSEQLAYWVNLYNALTVDVVLAHPGKDSILRMGDGWFDVGPWDKSLLSVAGETLTLNDIEHRILRPIWRDRRIHYALNCASLGCPNLDPRAYTGVTSEQLLAAAELAYINHERGIGFDDRNRLVVSKIYEWYVEDFASDRQGLLDYLGERHGVLGDRLKAYTGRVRYDYDWALNVMQ
ncbi:MAG: DUF547 domain-containing protein [Gammaproteobacteria bacterium]|nr:DUF547 domain-containing protein [Gammaproteobacteria bacterium]